MNNNLLTHIKQLADKDKFEDIVTLVEQTPEQEWDSELIQCYVRALNNTWRLDKAVEVSLRYQEQETKNPYWHYRLGYAYVNLNRYGEAETVLNRGKELAGDDTQVIEWIDELLDQAAEEKEDQAGKAEPEARRPASAFVPEEPVKPVSAGDYTAIIKHGDNISVCFYIEQDKPFAIGEKMNQLNEEAYMNGYNWEAFFNYYLPKYAPDIMEGLDSDPEAGMYAAYYKLTPENEKRAEKFIEIIRGLIENENELYRIIRAEGEGIEWD